jgi:hypothetical protein
MQQVINDIGASGLIKIYDGAVSGGTPANVGTALTTQVLLATLTCSATFGTDTNGVLTASAITSATAGASGTATFFRITTSGGTAVLQGTVGATGSGADLILSTTTVTSGVTVSISSLVITEGNA